MNDRLDPVPSVVVEDLLQQADREIEALRCENVALRTALRDTTLPEATAAVLREVRRFYEVGCFAGTSSLLGKAWEFYVAAADVAGVPLPEYEKRRRR